MTDLIDVRSWDPQVRWETRPDGTILVCRADPLGPYPRCMSERLAHWAAVAPDRPWIAQRDEVGGWRQVTYGEALDAVRRIGQALIDRGLGPDRPLVILSGNDIEHALMALGAQHVGVPSAAVSTAYSLVSTDHERLRDIAGQLEPGLVYAADGELYGDAIAAAFPGLPVVTAASFADMAATEPTGAVDAAAAAVGPARQTHFTGQRGASATTGIIKGNEGCESRN
jgi:feruloyl-CoA synthase